MRRFGLIGRPLGHSASAAYFTDKFMSEGITDCEYSLYELSSIEALPALLERLPELCGLNITIPYKREVMAFLDEVSPEAQAIGAVNCIRRAANGSLTGYNTDIIGLRAALDELLGGEQPSAALILGTLHRPCNMPLPNATFPLRWFHAMSRKAITPMITCHAKSWRRAG